MGPGPGSPRVLVVEDGASERKILRGLLENAGYAVETAADGEEGRRAHEAGSFDAVIADVRMPRLDGYGLCRAVKSHRRPETPVLLQTVLDEPADVLRGLECGADGYLVKPIDPDVLLPRLARILERAAAGDDPAAGNGPVAALALDAPPHRLVDYLLAGFEDFARVLSSEREARRELRGLTEALDAAHAQIEAQGNFDPLTGLLNRRGLEGVLDVEASRSCRAGYPLVVALVDLDDFKWVNDTLGHAVGDVVLQEIAERLDESIRPSDHLARIGGDEFLVLLPDTRWAEAARIGDRLRLAVSESPLRVHGSSVTVTASLGVSILPADACSIEEALSLTHLVLEKSKRRGKNRISLEEEPQADLGPVESTEDIAHLLRLGTCFRSFQQPIVSLLGEKVTGHEMLARGPAGAFENPNDFFRVCLEGNMLTLADLACLKAALSASTRLESHRRINVNLFPSTILDTRVDRLLSLFDGAPPGREFCVEISEQQFIGDPAFLRAHVTAFKERGIRVALDDVGFGRSSLESMLLLEPDVVKIDRKYVDKVSKEPDKERSLRRLVTVVHALGAELVAEGIEEREDLGVLIEMGVTYGQGYLWGRPEAVADSDAAGNAGREAAA